MIKNNNDIVKISFRISLEEKKALMNYAAENDLTMSQIIRRAVKEFLDKENQI